MKLRNQLLLATGCSLIFLASCQSSKNQIIGKWQIDSFESPSMDSITQVRKKAIDTISHVDSSMASMLGTSNLDSIKKILKSHADDYKQQQKDASVLSSVSFLKNGDAVFHTGIQNDTSKWEIVGKNKLILSPSTEAQKKAGAKPDTAYIETISKEKIRLKLHQGKNLVFVNLRPYTKADSMKANDMIQKQQQMMQEQMQQMQQMQKQQQSSAKPAEK